MEIYKKGAQKTRSPIVPFAMLRLAYETGVSVEMSVFWPFKSLDGDLGSKRKLYNRKLSI